MNEVTKKIHNLRPHKHYDTDWNCPSVDHCLGTDRLFGEYFVKAIDEILEIDSRDNYLKLDELGGFVRSYIVLDDYLRDDSFSINEVESDYVSEWILAIRLQCDKIIAELGGKEDLLKNYIRTTQYFYETFTTHTLFDAVIGKCNLVWMAFEFDIYKNSDIVKKLENDLKKYLFCLQLMDDLHDIEEDVISPFNHNLFVSTASSHDVEFVLASKPIVLSIVINIVIHTLNSIHFDGADTLNEFKKKMNAHAMKVLNENDLVMNEGIYTPNIEDWSDKDFIHELKKVDNSNFQQLKLNMNSITAEAFHSGGKVDKEEKRVD